MKTGTDKIEWMHPDEEPPQRATGQLPSKWRDLVDQLDEFPGRWAKLAEGKSSKIYAASGNLRSGRVKLSHPLDQYEFITRSIDEDTVGLYGRWTGGN